MSTLSALGARALPTPTFPAATQQYGKTGRSHTASAAGNGGNSTGDGSVSLSDDSILQNRAATLGSATVDYAQNLLSSFSQQAFGDASKGETISFDSVSLDTSSVFAESAQQSSGANGSSSAAAGLSDSAHFIGKGTITTTDGRTFDFEVEVQYNDKLEVGASQGGDGTDTTDAASPDTSTANTATAPVQGGAQSANSTGTTADASSDTSGLPTVQLPNLDFDGGLADLFQLIARQIQSGSSSSDSSASDASGSGSTASSTSQTDPFKALSIRLLKLVDSGNDTDLYTPSTPASTAANAKSLASTYGATAAAAGNAASAAPVATAPAAGSTTATSPAPTATPAATTTPASAIV